MKTIQEDIKNRSFRPVYLIYGEEAYLRQTLKKQLREALAGEDTMNYLYLEGKEADPVQIIDTAETLPFFAEKRLILLEDTGFFKKDSTQIADYLPRMPETTCLVFVEEAIDKRNKLYKQIQKLGYAAECARQSPESLKRWAARGLAQAGKKITGRAMEIFLSRTGEDMENIRQELDKLISYVGERSEIVPEDVEVITTNQITGRIFEMIDAIAVRDQRKAMELYYDLLMLKEPPMKIMVLIARQFHALLQVKEMEGKGLRRQEIASRGKWRPFIAERYMRQASHFRREELERFIQLSVDLDESVKQGNLRDGLAAEMLIVAFTEK